MQKIYILIDSSVDGGNPIGTTLVKERAELAEHLSPYVYMTEMEVESLKIPEHPEGHCAWSVIFNLDAIEVNEPRKVCVFSEQKIPSEQFFGGFTIGEHDYPPSLQVLCWAVDEEDAKKVAIKRMEEWKKLNNIT